MKLYFYFLETETIRCEECEVNEMLEAYSPIDKFPEGYSGIFVMKRNIGEATGHNNDSVILTEKSAEKAANIFRDSTNLRISIQNRMIALANEIIKQCNENLSLIDEWESKSK